MSSADDTFFPIRRLHLVFAVSAVALAAVTVWMLAVDHARPWKTYQQTYRDRVEPWFRAARAADVDGGQTLAAVPAPGAAKALLRAPVIDAWGRTLSVEQIWLPDLTIDYNFRQVPRFDRCTTCHQGIDKSGPGPSGHVAGGTVQSLSLRLPTPKQPGQAEAGDELARVYGLVLAREGIVDPAAVTVAAVRAKSPAAEARLEMGDVITAVAGHALADAADLRKHLLDDVTWGQAVTLEVRRGLPQPYGSHPRLDLFVGSSSPHPASEFGCTICHDGQGSATDFTFASHTPNDPAQRADWRRHLGWSASPNWDYPMLPARLAESRCLLCHHDVTDLESGPRFRDPPAAKLSAGYQLVRQYGCFGCHEINGYDDAGRRIGPDMRLEPAGAQAADAEPGRHPGTLRKVGPSLANVAERLDVRFLADWIGDPRHFRPDTRMPQIFGQHEHLDGPRQAEARRMEAVEIRGIAEYLRAASRPVPLLPPPAGVTEAASAQRGQRLFELRGCLACHKHAAFPEGRATEGPDLSRLGSKYSGKAGEAWLASWLRDPPRHAPRTRMPKMFLEPVPLRENAFEQGGEAGGEPEGKAEGKPDGNAVPLTPTLSGHHGVVGEGGTERPGAGPRMTDPAADVAAWLVSARGWEPAELRPPVQQDLDQLALLYLQTSFPADVAAEYLKNGIPAAALADVPADARLLAAPIDQPKKLQYVGRRTIRRRGCYGCHDIPGFETAPPIGPELTDWGRKQPSQFAFEQINRYAEQVASQPRDDSSCEGFFTAALLEHRREGFIWQKLGAPRSFDYVKAAEKPYLEQLTMGRFNFSDAQREAIITFVLGLTARPPAEKFVYQPRPRQRAIVAGRKVLEKFACAECHALQMQRWTFQYDPAKFPAPPAMADYDFLRPRVSPAALAASRATDRRGLGQAEVVGMPRLDAKGNLQEEEDDDGNPQYAFTLWEPAVINGSVWSVGGAELLIAKPQVVGRRPAAGGMLAGLLYPLAFAEAKRAGATVGPADPWGWLPPPLVNEGHSVQPAWLHDYLLNPRVIRPAAVLRMPKFNLSSEEAGALVDYFAATAGADFPYPADTAQDRSAPPGSGAEEQRLAAALSLITDSKTYCAKCHLIGDYNPGGETTTILAPNLEDVGRRIRPDYLRRWLANPKSVLPYTPMPVNFPPSGQSLSPQSHPGDSRRQLDAVHDLLVDYQGYMSRRTSVRGLVQQGNARPSPAAKPEQPSTANRRKP